MDELQGSVKQLQAFMDESTQYLQKVSVQLSKCIIRGDQRSGLPVPCLGYMLPLQAEGL